MTTTKAWDIEEGWLSGDNSDGVGIYEAKSPVDATDAQSNVREYLEHLQQPQSEKDWANAITPSDEPMIEDISWKIGQLTAEDTTLTAEAGKSTPDW